MTQLEKRPEKLHWVEDEARLELALWVADYANAALAERGATALIKTLNLPQTEMFRMVSSGLQFSERTAIRESLFSQSYGDRAIKKAGSRAKSNTAFAVMNYFPNDTIPDQSGRFHFLGYFKYDPMAPAISDYLKAEKERGRVSIWAGNFHSRKSIDDYFGLPDHLPKNDGLWTDFEKDFAIENMERDFSGVETSLDRRNENLTKLARQLVERTDEDAIISALETVPDLNFLFFAYRFDYKNQLQFDTVEFNNGEWISFLGSFAGDSPRQA